MVSSSVVDRARELGFVHGAGFVVFQDRLAVAQRERQAARQLCRDQMYAEHATRFSKGEVHLTAAMLGDHGAWRDEIQEDRAVFDSLSNCIRPLRAWVMPSSYQMWKPESLRRMSSGYTSALSSCEKHTNA